jgi:hypothetical protein
MAHPPEIGGIASPHGEQRHAGRSPCGLDQEGADMGQGEGIDIGAREIYLAVHHDPNSEPVRCFVTFTEELQRLADWLQRCGVTTATRE